MKLKVLLFASAKELIGNDHIIITTKDSVITVKELLHLISVQYPILDPILSSGVISKNNNYISSLSETIQEGMAS